MMRLALALLALLLATAPAGALPAPEASIPIPSGFEVVDGDTLVLYTNDCPLPHEGAPRGCEQNESRLGPRDTPTVSVSSDPLVCARAGDDTIACGGARADSETRTLCLRPSREASDDLCALA